MTDFTTTDFIPDKKKAIDPNILEAMQLLSRSIDFDSMRELFRETFESKNQTINGLLSPGLYLFAGEPKIGKSFFMLQMAYNVSIGESFLGFEVPSPGSVYYLALEDTKARLQDRLLKMFGAKPSDNLFLATQASTIEDKLLTQLDNTLSGDRDAHLVIIDTLQKARKDTSNPFNYSADYDVMGKLKSIADKYNVSLIVVHHTRKQESNNKALMISGTNGLLGASDGAFIMYSTDETKTEFKVELHSRDHEFQSIKVKRDKNTLCFYRVEDEADTFEEKKDELLEKVSKLATEEHPVWIGTATDLLSITGAEYTPNSLSYYLNIKSRQLFSDYHIKYEKGRTNKTRLIRLTLIPQEKKVINFDEQDEWA
ncbi:MAG: helicase RepA family protein [Clostridiales bacterium]|nr:helicase RepA family protein [Clostridiales bacterium]